MPTEPEYLQLVNCIELMIPVGVQQKCKTKYLEISGGQFPHHIIVYNELRLYAHGREDSLIPEGWSVCYLTLSTCHLVNTHVVVHFTCTKMD